MEAIKNTLNTAEKIRKYIIFLMEQKRHYTQPVYTQPVKTKEKN